jgi:Mrp family chromosome partitioning ATPase
MSDQQQLTNPDGHCVGPASEQAGKADSCQGCPNQAICASAPKGPDPDIEFMRQRLDKVRHRVLVLSGKGGVGKSTMTKELGFALGRGGWLTGLVDTDICGPSLPRLTGVRDETLHTSADGWEPVSVDENVSLVSIHFLMNDKNEAVVWRGPRKNGMIKNFIKEVAWGELDCMLVDTPPGTSDEHISLVSFLNQCGGVSGAVIVTTPQEVAVADVRREINFCQKTNVPILGFIENMSGFVCPKCKTRSVVFPSSRGEGAAARLSAEFGPPVLGQIPLDPALMRSCEEGVPLADYDPEAPATKALDAVAERLVAILEAREDAGRRVGDAQ